MSRRETTAGILFIVLGALFALGATQLNMGTAARMGPGFFPLMLSGLLVLLGVITILQGRGAASPESPPIPWRGTALIIAAPIVFGVTVRGLGLVPALALGAGIAAYASQRMTHRLAFLLAVGLTLFCVLVFSYALGLPFERFGPWTRILSGSAPETVAP